MRQNDKGTGLCQHGHPERNKFYVGKFMTANDFTDEQSYMNEKRWLVNRLGTGWGVLCGLKVRPHANDRRKVVVEPGVAIDPYGHEIVVCREETVDLIMGLDGCPPDERPRERPRAQGQGDAGDQAQVSAGPPAHEQRQKSYLYYLSVKYEERGANPSPIMIDSCDGYKEECVYNRTLECYRFTVSREKPTHGDEHEHDSRCRHLLADPSQAAACPERPECDGVPLAAICYNASNDTTAIDIDLGMSSRKVVFSNEALFDLLRHMMEEAGRGWAAGNRRQHVPLLASTIRGVEYRDGKTATLDRTNGYGGKYPYRLTSDGDFIWITDREDQQVWRIDRATNKPVRDEGLYLDDVTWGIAFDGRYMWISHHDAFRGDDAGRGRGAEQPRQQPEQSYGGHGEHGQRQAHGKLTRVDACTLERWTVGALPECNTLPNCYRYPEAGGAPATVRLLPYAGEVVLHGGHIYVAHDLPKRVRGGDEVRELEEARTADGKRDYGEEGYELYLTRIDPARGCIVEVIAVPEADGRESLSRIEAMASDGDALWITYRASSRDRKGQRAVARKVTREGGASVVSPPYRLRGNASEHMAFDGTRLWVSHNDGLSAVNVETGAEEAVNTDTAHTALAYSGGSLLWAVAPGRSEAFLTRVDIFSEEEVQRIEFIEVDQQTAFEVTDMQFDGAYIYVAYYLKDQQGTRGVIHRLLP